MLQETQSSIYLQQQTQRLSSNHASGTHFTNDLNTTNLSTKKQAGLTLLEDVLFSGNPVEEKYTAEGTWVSEVTKRLPYVKKLDGKTLIREEGIEEEGGGGTPPS